MPGYTHVISSKGGESYHFLDDILLSYRDQIRRELGLLDGSNKWWAFSLWRGPEGVDLDEIDLDEFPKQFMQSGGSAEAMTVEVRFIEDDGVGRLYSVGRPGGDYSGEPSVKIPLRDDQYTTVYPNEAFTADEAADIYYHYFQTDRVPDKYPLREITPV